MSNEKEMISLHVDGKEIQAPKGENLLKLLIQHQFKVPYYCYHPGLSVAGACRMCFVEIEGQPKPVISCNTTIAPGMKVNTQSTGLTQIRKWNLAFHLINHPLDCPICDQSGECGLQEYYMKYGRYESDMHEPKVNKRKVVDLGKHVVLDSERCILCSRCVRFFDEVTKTSEMAIFNRGDRSEIGTYADRPLTNNYSLCSVNICPVGALTSKDFRFKKRVWFLKEFKSICPGCSTGCNITMEADIREKRAYRMLPRYNPDINGYWMCDYGAMRYKQVNAEHRLLTPQMKQEGKWTPIEWEDALAFVRKCVASQTVILITPQFTVEEIDHIYAFFMKQPTTPRIFHCVDPQSAFDTTITDELLMRKDLNPNSQGILQVSKKHKLDHQTLEPFQKYIAQNKIETLLVFAPSDLQAYPHFMDWLLPAQPIPNKIVIGTRIELIHSFFNLALPTLSFAEKSGTFINVQGISQNIEAGPKLVDNAKPISEILC
ncbi:MAG: (2Fe-2S)-binding protein [Deltaproteobacteria bacterium]|nr:(2Fe-2S)-binding protein [Deltaproteobacteria bacterium]